jgi:hypothetical protein
VRTTVFNVIYRTAKVPPFLVQCVETNARYASTLAEVIEFADADREQFQWLQAEAGKHSLGICANVVGSLYGENIHFIIHFIT